MMDGGYDAVTRAGPAVVLVLGTILVARAARRGGGRFVRPAAVGLRATSLVFGTFTMLFAAVGHAFHVVHPWLEPPDWWPSTAVPVGMTVGIAGLVVLAAGPLDRPATGPDVDRDPGFGRRRSPTAASMLVVAGVFVAVPSPAMLLGCVVAAAACRLPRRTTDAGRPTTSGEGPTQMGTLRLLARGCFACVYALLGALFAGSVAVLALTGLHAFSLEPTTPVELIVVAGATGASAVAVALGYLRRA